MKIHIFFITIIFTLITTTYAQSNIKDKLPKPAVEKELRNPIPLVSIFNILRNKFPDYFDKEKNYVSWFQRIEYATDDKKYIRSLPALQDLIICCKEQEQKKWDKESRMPDVFKTTRKILENALKNSEKIGSINTCKICLETIDPQKQYYFKLPCCQEAFFHEKCLLKWYVAHCHGKDDTFEKCPICRTIFSENTRYLLEDNPTYLDEHDNALTKATMEEGESIDVTIVVNPLINLLGGLLERQNHVQARLNMLWENHQEALTAIRE